MNDNGETKAGYTNHLQGENSPYLLSHAHNPVDWYPWGDAALERSKELDRPIFLSIGYAACHWCHVMERESFENEEIARLLNDNFVSIKVDREQRPDLDEIYMSFTTAMTGSGGWPMSVFLTPDLKPFYAGTYFPQDDRFGRPGFRHLLTEIVHVYREEREQLESAAETIFCQVRDRLTVRPRDQKLSPEMIAAGTYRLKLGVDRTWGGFGSAPKFPHAVELMLLMRQYHRTGERDLLDVVGLTLDAMMRGGIYDQIGGGFARYATDQRWMVPHFEKMLCDNALLVLGYSDAFQITGKEQYRKVVVETLDFILREMTDTSGGFYSALDADSEGEEGKFYVWSADELRELLGSEADDFFRYYNVTEQGNFEGNNILYLSEQSDSMMREHDSASLEKRIARWKDNLLDARSKRVRPITDDKILTSWNGLALAAFCRGYRITAERRYLDAARRNGQYVTTELFREGNLTHAWREGRHGEGTFLEDYSFYFSGLLELYQVDGADDNSHWLEPAAVMAQVAIDRFQDDAGRFHLRESGLDDLIVRPSSETDSALPAPGSVLIEALLKLARITGDRLIEERAEHGLRAISGLLQQRPERMAAGLIALDYQIGPKTEIVIVGEGTGRGPIIQEAYLHYLPNGVVVIGSSDNAQMEIFKGKDWVPGEAAAFVCVDAVCGLPIKSPVDLAEKLRLLK